MKLPARVGQRRPDRQRDRSTIARTIVSPINLAQRHIDASSDHRRGSGSTLALAIRPTPFHAGPTRLTLRVAPTEAAKFGPRSKVEHDDARAVSPERPRGMRIDNLRSVHGRVCRRRLTNRHRYPLETTLVDAADG